MPAPVAYSKFCLGSQSGKAHIAARRCGLEIRPGIEPGEYGAERQVPVECIIGYHGILMPDKLLGSIPAGIDQPVVGRIEAIVAAVPPDDIIVEGNVQCFPRIKRPGGVQACQVFGANERCKAKITASWKQGVKGLQFVVVVSPVAADELRLEPDLRL